MDKGWVDYALVIAGNKLRIAAATLLCGIVAAAGYSVMPKTYESGLAMDVGVVSYAPINSNVKTETIEPVLSLRDLVISKPFMAEVISRLGLKTTPEKLLKKVKAKVNEDFSKGSDELNRQVLITAKGDSPEQAKQVADTIADLTIQRHRLLFSQAMENRSAYEETIKEQIGEKSAELAQMQKTLDNLYKNGNPNTASLVLLQANIQGKEEQLTNMKRELSVNQLLYKTNLKSANTVVSVPSYLPTMPAWSWATLALAGLVVGFLASCAYYVVREAMASVGKTE